MKIYIRTLVARNPNVSRETLEILAKDKVSYVRTAVYALKLETSIK